MRSESENQSVAITSWRVTYRFTVHGPAVGYYTAGKKPTWKRQKAYHDYKAHVQKTAELAGVGRLVASADHPVKVHTVAYFKNSRHPDPGNVQKGVCDALFYRKRGHRGTADKYTGGSFLPPLYDKENPRVEVIIEEPDVIEKPAKKEERKLCLNTQLYDNMVIQCQLENPHPGQRHEALWGHSILRW